jgi:hypothetical protein
MESSSKEKLWDLLYTMEVVKKKIGLVGDGRERSVLIHGKTERFWMKR